MSEVIQIGTQRFIYNDKKKQWVDEKTGKWAGEVILKIIDKALELDKKRQDQNENEENDEDFKGSREQAKPKKPKVPKYEEPGQSNEKPEVSKDTVPENKRLPQKDIEEKVVQSTEKVSIGGQEFVFNEKKQEWQDKKTKTKVSPNLMMIINQALKKDNPEIETKPKLKDIIDKPENIEKKKTAKKRLAEQTKKQLKNISLFLTYTENAVNDLDAISMSSYKLISFTHDQEIKVSKESEFSYSESSSEINFDSLSNLFDKLAHAIDSFKERLSNQKETSSGIGTTAKRSIQKAKGSVKKVSQKAIKVAKDTVQKVATKIPSRVKIAAVVAGTAIGGGYIASKIVGKIPLPTKEVATAIESASTKTGVDQSILYSMIKQESAFNPNAKAKTSTAKGLGQFLNKTWDGIVKKYSAQYPELLKGQYNPEANALATALYIKDNAKVLSAKKIKIDATSIYAAHFLGAKGALDLFNPNLDDKDDAVIKFPKEAKANHGIFYKDKSDSNHRSIGEVKQKLYDIVGKYQPVYEKILKGEKLSDESVTNTITKKKKTNNIIVIDNSTSSSNPINVIAQSSAREQKKAAESFSTQQQLLSYFNAN